MKAVFSLCYSESGGDEMKKMRRVAYTERTCQKCQKRVMEKVHDYGLLNDQEFHEKIGDQNIEIRPISCPVCGQEEDPEMISLYSESGNKRELEVREVLGSKRMPVMGEARSYGMARSQEEQAEYDRGLEKVKDVWEEGKEAFWREYSAWAMEDWRKAVSELAIPELVAGCQAVGMPLLPGSASVAAWRKAVREMEEENRRKFWQVANTWMVEESILSKNPDFWDMDQLVKRYGRERVRYVMLHVPLPEEFEKWRTEAIAGLVKKKKTGDTGILFERIGQLGQELDRQRRRSHQLGLQLRAERQQRAEMEGKLSGLRQELEAAEEGRRVIHRDPEDIRKIRSLKGLVRELRAEVERLNALIPEPEEEPTIEEEEPRQVEEEQAADWSHLEGKTVAVFGRLGDVEEVEGIRVIYHDGDRVNLAMARAAREADVWVVLTRLVSHGVMWRLKEYATDQGKEIRFVRETGTKRILERI